MHGINFGVTLSLYDKATQTEFTVYRHHPHAFLEFPKNFQISDLLL